MEIIKKVFGSLPTGQEVKLYTLRNDSGMEVDITNFGGIVTSIRIPDKHHQPGDIVLGYDTLEDYLNDNLYFGATVGRYANRIRDGRFTLEGIDYSLAVNNGPNHLHGGLKGFNKVLWSAATEKRLDAVSLKLGYQGADMEEGYPGNVLVEVDFTLNDQNELVISYRATTDRATHINLTNHSYFNLDNCRGTIHDHLLMIDADRITELDENSAPTGVILDVSDTPFDFRAAKTIGEDIEQVPPGFDINYVLNDYDGELHRVATVYHEKSGRTMDVLTTEPGVQLYTSNYVENVKGKEGLVYDKHSALCLETQHFADSPNQPAFPSTLLRPGEEYNQVTIYRFKW